MGETNLTREIEKVKLMLEDFRENRGELEHVT